MPSHRGNQAYYCMLISVDPMSAAVPLSYGGKNPSVSTDHSRTDVTDLHMQVKVIYYQLSVSRHCTLSPNADRLCATRYAEDVAVQMC